MPIHQFAQFSFDTESGCLSNESAGDKQQVQLRHKVASLLAYLIEHRARIVTKEELLSKLWLHGDYRENSLTQSIRELRLALGDKAKDSSFVKTYPQRGYQWICQLNEQQAESVEVAVKEPTSNAAAPVRKSNRLGYGLGLLLLVVVLIGMLIENLSSESSPQTNRNNPVQSLLVLPLVNATNDPDMAWLELGLADMLASNIGSHSGAATNQLQITPPAMANMMLLEAELPWPTLPVHIRSLLREQQLEVALFASVRLHQQQQVFDFQLIYADGTTKQGSISYPSLPAAVAAISAQLRHLLQPNLAKSATALTLAAPDDAIAAQALAQGIQALQLAGPFAAKKYFSAASTLEQPAPWPKAYLGRSLYALGDWQQAELLFNQITPTNLSDDPQLDAFVQYWRAELEFRRGSEHGTQAITETLTKTISNAISKAISKAEHAGDLKIMAQSYRLRAQMAWQQMDWAGHQQWSAKAQRLFGTNGQLSIAADKFFYLGNPSNEGLEKAPDIDLALNQTHLLKALNFYQQLDNQPMIAASQFAIAQNYSLELEIREQALNKTLALYRQLQQPYELSQVLIYAGFYQMQLHNGERASEYFEQAKAIATRLGALPLLEDIGFYLAFATLDQGLDQSASGRHGKNIVLLEQAIGQLELFIATEPAPTMRANALLFLGWAHADLGDFERALPYIEQAKLLNQQHQMQTTLGYSSYSLMRIYLARNDYQAVIAMADDPITTRLQANYLARAYYEIGQSEQAITTLKSFKQQFPAMWQPKDARRLAQYQSLKAGAKLKLIPEPPAHLTYCESDWVL